MIMFNRLGQLGRLGNQLFQIAATASHALACNTQPIFNRWDYRHYFLNQINDPLDPEVMFVNGAKHNLIAHTQFGYKPIPQGQNLCLFGYFQSSRYFHPQTVEWLVKPSAETMRLVRDAGKDLIHRTNTVAIHVRRGDYLEKQQYHPVQPIEYYQKAMETAEKALGNCFFLVFSDDPEWCNANFSHKNLEILNKNQDIVDLFLMAQCQHHIIANSSFSWWGAWLRRLFNSTNHLVVAPKEWAGPQWKANAPNDVWTDIYEPSWTIL